MAHKDLLDRIKRLDVQTIENMSPEVIARLTHNFDEILVKNMLYTATTNYEQRKLIKIIKKAYKSWKKDTDMLWGSMPQLESYPEYMEELQTDIECGLVITEKGVFEEDHIRLKFSLIPPGAVALKGFQKGFQSALSKDEVNSHQIPATASPVQNSEQQSVIELQDARIKELEAEVDDLNQQLAEQESKHITKAIRIKKEFQSKMSQFLHLAWKKKMFENEEGGSVTLKEVNSAFTDFLGFDFNSWSGNLSSLYRGGNWEGLKKDISDVIDTQQSLLAFIEKASKEENEKRNP